MLACRFLKYIKNVDPRAGEWLLCFLLFEAGFMLRYRTLLYLAI